MVHPHTKHTICGKYISICSVFFCTIGAIFGKTPKFERIQALQFFIVGNGAANRGYSPTQRVSFDIDFFLFFILIPKYHILFLLILTLLILPLFFFNIYLIYRKVKIPR